MKIRALAFGALCAGALLASPAFAAEVLSVGISTSPGGVGVTTLTPSSTTTVVPGDYVTTYTNDVYGGTNGIDINSLSVTYGYDSAVVLDSTLNALGESGKASGTYYIYVTLSGITSPTAYGSLTGDFTIDSAQAVSEYIYYSGSDTLYDRPPSSLWFGSGSHNGVYSSSYTDFLVSASSPYSVTEVFKVVIHDHQPTQDTIALTGTTLGGGIANYVPEPATWALMFFGFVSIGFAMRRSRRLPKVAGALA